MFASVLRLFGIVNLDYFDEEDSFFDLEWEFSGEVLELLLDSPTPAELLLDLDLIELVDLYTFRFSIALKYGMSSVHLTNI